MIVDRGETIDNLRELQEVTVTKEGDQDRKKERDQLGLTVRS
jgi:hypothetical protein